MADGFWLAQGVGGAAALIGVVAFQLRNTRAMLLALAASALVWALHFLLLAAPAAAAIHLVTALRNLGGVGLSGHRSRRWLAGLFAGFYVAAAALAWDSPWDLLPLAAVLAGTAAVFVLSGLRVRLGFLFGSLCWVAYSLRVGSLPGVVMMAADAASNLRFILRHRHGLPPGPPAG